VTQAVLRRVNARLQDLPGYARVRAVHLSLEPWTVEAGLLTPTLKLKRHVLEERFGETIRDLYADHG
jgi:long-chain acyl-CoA synthetase